MTRRQILRYAKRVLLSLNTVKAAYLPNSETKIRLFRVTAKKGFDFLFGQWRKGLKTSIFSLIPLPRPAVSVRSTLPASVRGNACG